MPPKLPSLERQRIEILRLAGYTYREIREATGHQDPLIARVLHHAGLTSPPARRHGHIPCPNCGFGAPATEAT